jgi:hydrogenase-4 component F
MTLGPFHGVLTPLLFALVAFAVPSNRWRPFVLPVAGLTQVGIVLTLASGPTQSAAGGWIVLDPLAKLVSLTVAVLFLFCALYAPAYLRVRSARPNRVLCAGLLVLVGMLTAVSMAHHLGLLWVALEATTLASAPLIWFNQTPRALEATWKYLLICSVGIALALFGSFLLAYAALRSGHGSTLLFDDLVASAGLLSKPWLHAAFVTLLVGYGTKMGLAPMHTWKPDAYGEAPGILGAMLAGGVTSGAFVAILRLLAIMRAAGEGEFARSVLVGMGLLSMLFGAVFMVRQKDIKRMLAYSSVEHMGILVIGAGVGGLALFGALLHLVANAMTKGVLFLASGNIHRAFGSKSTDVVRGASGRVPVSAALFLAGFFAITGSPPFGPFISELTILRGLVGAGLFMVAGVFLFLLMAVFLGMGGTVLTAVQGEPPERQLGEEHVDTPALVLPIAGLLLVVICLGVWIPAPFDELLRAAAAQIEGKP